MTTQEIEVKVNFETARVVVETSTGEVSIPLQTFLDRYMKGLLDHPKVKEALT